MDKVNKKINEKIAKKMNKKKLDAIENCRVCQCGSSM
jgi:hypothetical protein